MTMPVTPAGRLDIVGAGNLLLNTLSQQLEVQGVKLPKRVGLVPGGLVAYDGDLLSIGLTGITRGKPAHPTTQGDHPSRLTQFYEFEVNLLRPVAIVSANGQPPSPQTLTDEFAMLAADAEGLWAAIVTIHANYLIVAPTVPFVYGPLITVGPEGGIAGHRCPVAWQATT